MKKLLTICIPTYKRPITLRRCIESVASQIEKYALSTCVDIYVTNDASPDDTVSVLNEFVSLDYFKGITRDKNLGMNVNIKNMLIEVAQKCDYQLIITDDDFLQPDILGELVAFLREHQNDSNRVSAIWTPRYSYTEDEKLLYVACKPFEDSSAVVPETANAAKYMNNGFVLSGLILRAESIDYEFWEQYKENAYFPMIFFGDLILRSGAYYWNRNLVHHTVMNECHWERWGKNDVVIALRLFTDYVNAYAIMAGRQNSCSKAARFYLSAFADVCKRVKNFLASEKFMGDRAMALDAINDLKIRGELTFNYPVRFLMIYAILIIEFTVLKSVLKMELGWLIRKKEIYRNARDLHLKSLSAMPIMFKIIFS